MRGGGGGLKYSHGVLYTWRGQFRPQEADLQKQEPIHYSVFYTLHMVNKFSYDHLRCK